MTATAVTRRGYGCLDAYGSGVMTKSVDAWATFRTRVEELGGTVLEPSWKGVRTPHRVRCAKGHECAPRPNSVQQGGGLCRACAGRDPAAAWTEFRARVEALGGVVLEEVWLGSKVGHSSRCVNGHACAPVPSAVGRNQGICLTCVGKDPATAERNFRARVTELGGEVLEAAWLGSGTPHRVRCSNGHECTPRPNCVQQGQGICRRCVRSRDSEFCDVFYVVAGTDAVKYGITSGNPAPRLSAHRRDGLTEVVLVRTGLTGVLAWNLERLLLSVLVAEGIEPVRGHEYFPLTAKARILDVVATALK